MVALGGSDGVLRGVWVMVCLVGVVYGSKKSRCVVLVVGWRLYINRGVL